MKSRRRRTNHSGPVTGFTSGIFGAHQRVVVYQNAVSEARLWCGGAVVATIMLQPALPSGRTVHETLTKISLVVSQHTDRQDFGCNHLICQIFTMVRPWREARSPIQTICSRLRSRTLRRAVFPFWLPRHCVLYRTLPANEYCKRRLCVIPSAYESRASRPIRAAR